MFGPNTQIVAYIARHGATELNEQNRFRGPLNVPLAPEGHEQAKVLAGFFAGRPAVGIIHSDRIRAKQTADAISEKQPSGVWVGSTPDLRAWNLGDFAGKPKSDANVDKLETDYVNHPDTPVPGGESLNDFRGRVRPILESAARMGSTLGAPPILVAHSSVVHEAGQMFNGDPKSALVEPGGVVAIVREGDRLRAVPLMHQKTESGGGGLVS